MKINTFSLHILLLFSFTECHLRFGRSTVFNEDIEDDHSHSTTEKSLDITTEHNAVNVLDVTTTTECPPCSEGSLCVPLVQCPAHVRKQKGTKNTVTCHLPKGKNGICCSSGQNHTASEEKMMRSSLNVDEKTIADAKLKSNLKLARLMEKEEEILANEKHNTILQRHAPSFGVFQSLRALNQTKTAVNGLLALKNVFISQALRERQAMNKEDLSFGIQPMFVNVPCPPPVVCHHSHNKYRTFDGSCNNIFHPTWGATRTATERLLPPNYHDGIWEPRKSVANFPLKSPRAISNVLLPDQNQPHKIGTLLLMQFGQFITHDVSSSVSLTLANGEPISCCTEDGSGILPPEFRHFGCLPIEISPEDPFYKQFNQRCMNFVRTQLAPSHDCSIGYAKQMNGVTHFLDLSQVYGSDVETLSSLREWSGGRLHMHSEFGRDLLPLSKDKDDCISVEKGSACFKSGDGHANQMISLVAVHTLFNREHNRIAGHLAALNPHWSEQLIFLEARKIVIAEYQHIIYNEYLPLIIGEKAMFEFGLFSAPPNKYSFDYHEEINPSLTAEFSVAAFRFGHSTVDGKLKIPKKSEIEEVILIPEVMFHPARMRIKEFFDRLLLGLTSQPMQSNDVSISEQLTKYLFRGGNPFGLDLASLNIQRGVDHGLRSYNDYRELIGLPKIQDFHEFGDAASERLKLVYASPDDIDLWVGGLLEIPENGAMVGPTFREIIADQFSRFRKGDRYFYEHSPATNPGFMTHEQLAQIKKTSMARIICDNSDHLELFFQSPNSFVRPDMPGNAPIPCEHIPSVEFIPWKEF